MAASRGRGEGPQGDQIRELLAVVGWPERIGESLVSGAVLERERDRVRPDHVVSFHPAAAGSAPSRLERRGTGAAGDRRGRATSCAPAMERSGRRSLRRGDPGRNATRATPTLADRSVQRCARLLGLRPRPRDDWCRSALRRTRAIAGRRPFDPAAHDGHSLDHALFVEVVEDEMLGRPVVPLPPSPASQRYRTVKRGFDTQRWWPSRSALVGGQLDDPTREVLVHEEHPDGRRGVDRTTGWTVFTSSRPCGSPSWIAVSPSQRSRIGGDSSS